MCHLQIGTNEMTALRTNVSSLSFLRHDLTWQSFKYANVSISIISVQLVPASCDKIVGNPSLKHLACVCARTVDTSMCTEMFAK